ncbi:hypothetical protein Poli38472_008562 [Pythium oligandrum]|uniref:Sensor domain-containing protein n=1 Tax=Pythium oligandrum TaxID=41045 RepID=A0A8K1C3P4_PYTOL|nr:hypothetical protein Poli38472_008562 [Pythium oligandrum]|eukprot:TMW55914.1 hypothetical protein Poli38472_008562 [Pythium oligandrum]
MYSSMGWTSPLGDTFKSIVRMVRFQVALLLSGLFLLLLWGLTLGGLVIWLVTRFSSRIPQEFIELLWSMEYHINALGIVETPEYPYFTRTEVPVHPRRRITASMVLPSTFYFLWPKSVFNFLLGAICLTLWFNAAIQFMPSTAHTLGVLAWGADPLIQILIGFMMGSFAHSMGRPVAKLAQYVTDTNAARILSAQDPTRSSLLPITGH